MRSSPTWTQDSLKTLHAGDSHIMTPINTSRTKALAQAINDLLAAPDTHPKLRARLSCCISELRDELPEEAARRLAGLEAEAVITSFDGDAHGPIPSQSLETLLENHRKHHERSARYEDTAE